LKTKWTERKSAGYSPDAREKRRKHEEEEGERNTIREAGMPVKKWKD
jgi:hypothetical protein